MRMIVELSLRARQRDVILGMRCELSVNGKSLIMTSLKFTHHPG